MNELIAIAILLLSMTATATTTTTTDPGTPTVTSDGQPIGQPTCTPGTSVTEKFEWLPENELFSIRQP